MVYNNVDVLVKALLALEELARPVGVAIMVADKLSVAAALRCEATALSAETVTWGAAAALAVGAGLIVSGNNIHEIKENQSRHLLITYVQSYLRCSSPH